MSIEKMYKDRVDIYKLKSRQAEGSYGVPGPIEYYYSDTPDYENVKCSVQRRGSVNIVQGDPFQEVFEQYKLFLPNSIELEENYKVIFKGKAFYTGIPFSYRTHQEVELRRNDKHGKEE